MNSQRSQSSPLIFKYLQVLRRYCGIIFLVLLSSQGYSQKKDSTYVGQVNGTVRDSAFNRVLRSATLSIYKADNDQLLSYQLSNNFGKFHFKEIPIGIKLKLITTYVGYQPYQQEFLIPKDLKVIDLKNLNVARAENNLKEVNITAKPPMEMNGDTLVFNADAFKLDTNAVVEDLLRRLPGVTIWSDGLITVNGQKVNNVFVEGKPFFGSDARIATQNLPKNIVDKIQVYKDKGAPNEDANENPPLNMNIVLKKDKKSGMFGKIGGGYGTDKRFGMDGMLSAYGPKTQLSIVGARNNVNKTAYDVNTLMRYSSFKGAGVDVDYHSDFRQRGLNVFSSAGYTLAHEINKNNKLRSDYFFYNSQNEVLETVQQVDNLNNGSQLVQNKVGTSDNGSYSHRFSSSYDLKGEHRSLSAEYALKTSNNNSVNTQFAESINTGTGIESISDARQENTGRQTVMDVDLKLDNRRYYEGKDSKSLNFDVRYILNNSEGNDNSRRTTDFSSTEAGKDQFFDRQYKTDYHNTTHTINANLPDIKSLLKLRTQLVNINFKNAFVAYNSNERAKVGDFNQNGQLVVNNYLTNNNNYQTINEKPALSLSRSFTKGLANRYHNTFGFNLILQGQLFDQHHTSDKDFQKVDRTYTRFIPESSISFGNSRVGHYQSNYTLKYAKSFIYANIYQLAPLVDSSNVYYRHVGNPDLTPSAKHEISLSLEHYLMGVKNSGNGSFSIHAGTIKNFIGDSSLYDAVGRNTHYNVNLSGNKYAGYSGFLYKTYQLKKNQLTTMLQGNLNYAHNPAYVNDIPILTKSFSTSHHISLSYTYKHWIKFGGGQSLNTFSTRQTNSISSSYKNFSTSANAAVNWPKKVHWSSIVNYNRSTSSYSGDVNFIIWNADVAYRFLKGDNAELKFSALDLLRQNKSVISSGNGNSITQGTVNVLQQYFMFSLAYYPRMFGSRNYLF